MRKRRMVLSRWLVQALHSMIQSLVLAMLDAWHDCFFSGAELASLLRRLCDLDIQHVAMLINVSPQRRPFSIDGEKDLIQMPLVPPAGRRSSFAYV
jgi:hypothetical protein